MTNPFNTGSKIRNPEHFIGRIRESEDIFAKINNNNSVSVVGDRRIGKSSLLYYIHQTAPQRLGNRVTVYMDMMSSELKTLEGFVLFLLTSLKISFEEDQMQKNPNVFLSRQLRGYCLDNPTPILLIDEFDTVKKLPEFFNDDFLENLRSICTDHLCVVTASKLPLKNLIDDAGLTSPFWNIFTHLPLGEFVIDDALDERQDFLWRYWKDLTPSDTEMRFLLSYTSTHPLIMQIVSFNVLQNRDFPRREEDLRKKIETDLSSHFRDTGDKIQRWLHAAPKQLPEKIEWTSEFIGRILKNLNPLKDFKLF